MDRDAEPDLGSLLDGRFRLDAVLGRGGFGTVYKATDTSIPRTVAVKVLHAADATIGARFRREVQVVGNLDHPNIVKLIDAGEFGGRSYAAFEFFDGEDLRKVLQRHGTLPVSVVRHLLAQVLSALVEAHRQGLVHRDIKPANLLIHDNQGDPWGLKLLDFGIARTLDPPRSQVLTKTGELLGTARYMSPEQLRGERASSATDIYSLGLVCHELMQGEDALFGATFLEQVERARGPLDIAEGELAQLLRQMTSLEPERRPSASSCLAQLTGTPVAETVRHRGRSSHALVVAVLLVSLVAAAAVVWRSKPGSETLPPARPPAVTAEKDGRIHFGGAVTEPPGPEKPAEPETAVEPSLVPGCSEPEQTGRYLDGNDVAQWWTYVPKTHATRARSPIIVTLNQRYEKPDEFLAASQFEQLAEEYGLVVIAPVSTHNPPWKERDDLPTIHAAIEGTKKSLCVDPAKVYVVGHGQGGRAAERLTCDDSIAGVAISSHRQNLPVHDCETPRPYIVFHPMDTKHEPVEGGTGCFGKQKASVADVDASWRERNSCADDGEVAFEYKGSRCTRWACETPFESCLVNGGHPWPGMKPRLFAIHCDGPSPDFPMAERILTFFGLARRSTPTGRTVPRSAP